MALHAAGVFEVRPDGQANQTGFFFSGAGGLDLSQQAAPAISVTDGVTNGTTTVTSASANFAANMVGNGISIGSDSWYEIVAVVSATQITVDRATLNGGSGRVLVVGGATLLGSSGFSPIFQAVVVAGHKLWVRGTNSAGVPTTYTPGSAANIFNPAATAQTNPVTFEGYSTVRGDGGLAVISNALGIAGTSSFQIIKNFEFTGNTGIAACFHFQGAGSHLENLFLNPGSGNGPTFLQDGGGANDNVIRRVYAIGPSSGGNAVFDLAGGGCVYEYCDIAASSGGSGVSLNSQATFRSCIIRDNHAHGVRQNAAVSSQFFGCVFWNNGSDGVQLSSATVGVMDVLFENCIFGLNAGYDLEYTPADLSLTPGAIEWAKTQLRCNWFFTTGTGRYHQLPAAPDDTSLTVNPFVSSATGNFTLNGLTGGGAAISGKPCVVAFADGLNSASVMAGFAGSAPTPSSFSTLVSLWRERTNERLYPATNSGVPDSTVAVYLDWALHWLNRASGGYYYVTDSTSLALVAGQQEYSPYADLVNLKWLQFGLTQLAKSSVERWRADNERWNEEPPGEPREFAQYGLTIVLRPTPSAEAVAANPTMTGRYIGTPAPIMTSGALQLPTQAYRIVVDKAAALWFESYPDTALAEGRITVLNKEAEEAALLFGQEIAARDIAR